MTLLQSTGGLLSASVLAWAVAAVLGLGALGVLAGLLGQPARRRPLLGAGAAVAALLAAAHVAVALELPGQAGVDPAVATAAGRIGAYAVALPLVLGVLGHVGGLARTQTVTLAVAAFGHVAGVAGWLVLDGQVALAALGTGGVLGAIAAYVAVDAASRQAGVRRLLGVQLLGVVALTWLLTVVGLALSPRGAGVLDAYTATFLGGYVDVAFGLGVGGLLATSGDGLDEIAGAPTEREGAVAASSGDADQPVEAGVGDGGTITDGAGATGGDGGTGAVGDAAGADAVSDAGGANPVDNDGD